MTSTLYSFITFLTSSYLISFASCKATIPSFVSLCKKSDPNFDKCVVKTVGELKPYLAKGIPEMKVVPLSPFKIEKLSLKTSGNLELVLTDVELINLMEFEVNKFHYTEQYEIILDLTFSAVEVKGKYKLKGHLLMFELNGSGNCVINLNNIVLKTKITPKKTQKDGKEFLDYTNIDIGVEVQDGQVDFQNLFANNKQLTDQTNTVLNENIKVILKDFEPIIATSLKSVILTVVNNVFLSFPVNDLFVD